MQRLLSFASLFSVEKMTPVENCEEEMELNSSDLSKYRTTYVHCAPMCVLTCVYTFCIWVFTCRMYTLCVCLDSVGTDFVSEVRSVRLKSGQTDTLNIHYLPFYPGIKYCSVLLVCPQVCVLSIFTCQTLELNELSLSNVILSLVVFIGV